MAAMTPEQIAEMKADVERAHSEVGEVCRRTGPGRWRMSIPARPDRDSDLVISRALTHADALLTEVERLRKMTATCTCGSTYETYQGPEADERRRAEVSRSLAGTTPGGAR